MTSSPPFHRMPWYPRDFACATRGWPLVARGVYRELLDAQWDAGGISQGTLPADEKTLREIAHATPAQWRIAWPFVAPKFPLGGGGRRNERLEQHRAVAVRQFLGRQEGAQKTNTKRWGGRSASQSATRLASQSVTNQRLATTTTTTAREERRGLRGVGGTESEAKTPPSNPFPNSRAGGGT